MITAQLRNSWWGRVLSLAAGSSMLLSSLSGCSRTFWRLQADDDSYDAITEKLTNPLWNVPRIDMTPNPASRFYDPFNPDCEPLPPDDPAAHVSMHWVDGWEGYKGWHKFGDLLSVENPQWLANYGISADMIDPLTGEYVAPVPALRDVRLVDAVELAQINNREYQFQIESVYLAALAVTFQRFQFGVRYLTRNGIEPTAGATAFFTPHGVPDGATGNYRAGVSQLLPAGTQWAVELANNTLWLFSGGSSTNSMSTLSFSIVQPLLFGAGRKVGLEGLTQSERTLLYQTRILARFRQELFTDVVGGPNGFLVLLQDVQQIENARGNVRRLEENVDRLLAESARSNFFANVPLAEPVDIPPELAGKLVYEPDLKRLIWGNAFPISEQEVAMIRNLRSDAEFQGAVDDLVNTLRTEVVTLDVLNLQTRLANSINSLRALERQYQDRLDGYKLLLGLPPDMLLTINEDMLKPFDLIDPRLEAIEEEGKRFVDQWETLQTDDPDIETLNRTYQELGSLVRRVRVDALNIVTEDLQQVQAILPERLSKLREEEARQQLQADIDRAGVLFREAKANLELVEGSTAAVGQLLHSGKELSLEERLYVYSAIGNIREELVQLAQNLAVVQLSVRVEMIQVQPFEMSMQRAVQLGMECRVDLMNARAQVMDSRRRVEVAANALQSALNIVAEADVRTPNANRPFDFRGDQSELRAGLQFTAPLDQIDERNAYRITQIAYQRQRRAYMLFEDEVKQQIRVAWRQLFVLRQNLETSQRAVRLAALQYDSAVNAGSEPGRVPSATTSSNTSGLQGNNLDRALESLLSAQNQLVSNYIQYERNRLNIYRDMGIMMIMEDGLWDDPFYRSQLHEEEILRERFHTPDGGASDMDAPSAGGVRPGWSRLGGGDAEPGVVAIPDGKSVIQAVAEEPDSRDSFPWAVSGDAVGAGKPRQPAQRYVDQLGGRVDDDHQYRSRGNDGEKGRSRL